jgi:hypothetical protein
VGSPHRYSALFTLHYAGECVKIILAGPPAVL